MSLVYQVSQASDKIQNGRTVQDILNHTYTELGELAQEVIIANGNSYKQPGKDGVVGEAIDAIVCLLDLITIYDPTLTESDLMTIAGFKLQKWIDTAPDAF